MKKYKQYLPLIIIGVIAIIIIVASSILNRPTNNPATPKPDTSGMILFFGDTCPHCKVVAQYVQENNVHAKYQFAELEVYNNKDNATLLVEKAKSCKLDTSGGVGVPFFFDGQNCLLGSDNIINFFKK